MNIARKTIVASVSGFALTMGLVVIVVLSSMFLPFQELQQIMNPYIIFMASLLIVFPLIFQRLNRLDGKNKIFGWTLIGFGAQLLFLPVPFLFLILRFSSTSGLLFGGMMLMGSVVFGVPAGLLASVTGAYLLKHR